MTMMAWLESTWLSQGLGAVPWGFPIAEALHFVGLCVLMGSLAVMDLRLLGFARALPIRIAHDLLPWAWAGFTINLVTGVYFFLTQPTFYYPNTAFRIKLILMFVAGVNALWFQFRVSPGMGSWPATGDAPAQVKAMAGASLVLWVAVICFGRFIMYWPPI